jgi:hypothetical protein
MLSPRFGVLLREKSGKPRSHRCRCCSCRNWHLNLVVRKRRQLNAVSSYPSERRWHWSYLPKLCLSCHQKTGWPDWAVVYTGQFFWTVKNWGLGYFFRGKSYVRINVDTKIRSATFSRRLPTYQQKSRRLSKCRQKSRRLSKCRLLLIIHIADSQFVDSINSSTINLTDMSIGRHDRMSVCRPLNSIFVGNRHRHLAPNFGRFWAKTHLATLYQLS